jgi:putative tricarboxylic transport membrane protein
MKPTSRAARRAFAFALGCALAAQATPSVAQLWKPTRNVEVVVPFAAGAGVDVAARTMHAIWTARRLVGTSSVIVNKAGGGGNVGFLYVTQHPGDPHYLILGSSTLLTNQIAGISTLSHTDFTPVAVMLSEYLAFSVRADSPMKSGADFLQQLRKDPQSLSISIGSAPDACLAYIKHEMTKWSTVIRQGRIRAD